jgi:hypothetical protein
MSPQPDRQLDEERVPIPPELFSAYEAGPFRACSVCSSPFSESGCLYEIQKVFRGREAIFEMAVCERCGHEVCREFSHESLETLKEFFTGNFKPSPRADHCHFCGLPRSTLMDCTVMGICRGSSLIAPSCVLCERCGENLQARLSQKTREAQQDFIGRTFPGVPAGMDLKPAFCPGLV